MPNEGRCEFARDAGAEVSARTRRTPSSTPHPRVTSAVLDNVYCAEQLNCHDLIDNTHDPGGVFAAVAPMLTRSSMPAASVACPALLCCPKRISGVEEGVRRVRALVLPLQQDQSLHPDIAALADAVQKRSSLRNAAVIPFELSATS